MSQLDELISRIKNDPYNEVKAHPLPDGGIAIYLSHRITMDNAAVIRITRANDIRFFDVPEDDEAIERINQNGPWNILCDHKIHFGPGHQSTDTCRLVLGHEEEHEDRYGHTWEDRDERGDTKEYWD